MKYDPQLAALVKEPPDGDRWIHEIKYDGYRIGCQIRGRRITLTSRNGNDWTTAFPEIVGAAGELRVESALLDGEVAVLLPDGRTSFQAMQNRGGSRALLVYFVFDLLEVNGNELTSQPLEARKRVLEELVGASAAGRIRYAAHVPGSGHEVLAHACRLGLEGIVSKRRDLPYRSGRSDAWRKTKCTQRQEFVIGGFTDPQGSRHGLGALLLGHYAEGRLIFSGRVGTGFTRQGAIDLRQQLDALEQRPCPFDAPPAGPLFKTAHWVRPELVCEVAFTEWTTDGQLRHPSFLGVRRDKRPAEVRRERPGTSHAAAPAGGVHASSGRNPAARRPAVRRNR